MDRLLEIGFKEDIELISSFLPKSKRSLLFSATMTKETESVVRKISKDVEIINCVPKNEVETHLKIKQSCHVVPVKQQMVKFILFFNSLTMSLFSFLSFSKGLISYL